MKATVALVRMQTSKARRSLGFFRHNTYHAPLYVFIGKGERLEQCRQLAQRKGLEAQFLREMLSSCHRATKRSRCHKRVGCMWCMT